jgi:hypothetical protein
MVTMRSPFLDMTLAEFEQNRREWRRQGRELTRAYKRDKWRIVHRACLICDTGSSECLRMEGCCPTCIGQDFLAGIPHRR